MSINPPARRRPAVNPPARGKTPDWSIPDGVRPLGFDQKTHNGVSNVVSCTPDERFRPLLIVLDPAYRDAPHPLVVYIANEQKAMSPDTANAMAGHFAAGRYISEYILRDRMRYSLLSDDAYEMLRARIASEWDNKSKTSLNEAHKCMMKVTKDNDVRVDYTKAAGPYYCGALLQIERHMPEILQRVVL